MKLIKLLIVTLALSVSMGTFSSAVAAGKIENATAADVQAAVESAIKNAEEALSGLQSGADQTQILQNITSARQDSKRIEVGRLDLKRNQGSGKLKNARSALEKGDKAQAEEFLKEAVAIYKDIKNSL